MKAKAGTLIVLVLTALTTLFVGSASAWHVVSVTAHCDESKPQTLHVLVKLSDAGPGTYHDNFGKAGTFGHVKTFTYKTDTFGTPYRVSVRWATGERGTFGPVSLRKCEGPPPTSTTSTTIQEGTTSTTITSSTTSTLPTTTTIPRRSSTTTSAPPKSSTSFVGSSVRLGLASSIESGKPPSGSSGTTSETNLPRTGNDTFPLAMLGVCVLGGGAALILSTRKRAT